MNDQEDQPSLTSSIRGAKMTQSLAKQVNEMLELAKKVGNEAEFQQKPQYKKFKAKNIGRKLHKELTHLADGLMDLKFYEECIYWSHKIFEDLRILDKEDRHTVFNTLIFSYYNLKNYEKTLEYGQKSLDLQLKQPASQTIDTLVAMRVSASKIKRYQDASKYAKEILKINIVRCNEKEIPKHGLLFSYSNLIDLQLKAENIIGAKKTIKRLKIFNLNSIDPNDVLVSMEKEGYKKLLPLNDLLAGNFKDKEQNIAAFCNKNFSNSDDLKEFIVNLQMYHSAGKVCWMKFLIYRRFDSKQTCEKWGLLHMNILVNIVMHMNILVNREEANEDFEQLQKNCIWVLPHKHYIIELINCSLRLANDDPVDQEDRHHIFLQLWKTLLSIKESPINYIAEAIRKYPINVMQEAMPFIQYFIKLYLGLEEYHKNASEASEAAKCQERKEQMITLKNSLTIMNHFKTFSIRNADEL